MTSNVTDFYNGKSVFLTGGTGFVGVCLIEKLLRCCPNIENVYLLIRPKKGKEIATRLEELTQNSVFNRLREDKQTDLFKKLIAVAGDVGDEDLGLSAVDRATIINKVQIVFHLAATLDFEADLQITTKINLLGTRRVIQLCKDIKNLQAFVHVSSAYANAMLHNVDEIIYPAPMDADTLLKLIDTLDIDALKAQTTEILKGHANPYTLTKHLAEHEVANAAGSIPATIVRPSMIIGAWKEPIPGWTVSKNGPQGFIMGASKGIVRRLPIASHLIYDYIPVDIVINSLIVAGYNIDCDSDKKLQVYHCTSSTCNSFQWEKVKKDVNIYLHKYPLRSAVWYPHLKFLPSLFLFKLSAIFIHFIPAYILDAITRLCGGRPILVRLHKNINKSLNSLEKFIFQEWKFNNSRLLRLHESLSTDDQKLFNLDIRPMVWKDYLLDLIQGIRMYLLKESPKSLPTARSKNKILFIAHLGLQIALLSLVWWVIKASFATTWIKSSLIVPIIYLLFNQL